jgi:proline iminopeptidase
MFTAADGTSLAYHESGTGNPIVCLPGGPMQSSAYLGDLGGIPGRLIRLDPRGTGDSATPDDPESYRCDRQVDDVEALREHLERDRITLLGHSAGTNLVLQYATCYPDRVERLLLITPSPGGLGVTVTKEDRREIVLLRKDEPWFDEAQNAFDTGDFPGMARLFYGKWDEEYHESQNEQRNDEAAAIFPTGYTPNTTRAQLATIEAPVFVLAGEYDLNSPPNAVAEIAELFKNATFEVQPNAGHFPWRDDPIAFRRACASPVSGI